jgi:hypothetical protein
VTAPLPLFERTLCAALSHPPALLYGERLGEHWWVRAVLCAAAIDRLLVPATLCARRYGLTRGGVIKSAARGRALLARDPALARTVERSLARVAVPCSHLPYSVVASVDESTRTVSARSSPPSPS